MNCGMSLVKYVLFIFNLLCALCGIALLTIGIIVLVNAADLEKLFGDYNAIAAPILLIILGSVVFVIAFFGCCGAIRESHCLTMTYAAFMLILIIGQIVIAAITFAFAGDIASVMTKTFDRIFLEQDNVQVNRELVDTVQMNLQCCGPRGPADWTPQIGPIPPSCCESGVSQCNAGNAFQTGCIAALEDWVDMSKHIIAWVALGVALIQLVALIFACCLGNHIRNERRRYA
ncbi:23 kDa integral membrane protein-like isoform X2 [Phlebotomus argentipes]|uniref:23 kDa integral membrane protein-like isoform X2 n=1 Tax=Phlebotomus argentipes TaxID=94469 RepID=UPI0028934DFA|nr:23 kDa integral membrane protein-like isoform X2 [Phlebotomus argentipes]